jgi:betaine-aldehyde dehydrogenase
MKVHDKLYLDGGWSAPAGRGLIEVVNAATEEVMGQIPEGTPEDVDRAVQAARSAFGAWAGRAIEDRARVIERMKEGLAARAEEIARTITGEVGMPLSLSRAIQAGSPIAVMGSYAGLLRGHVFEETVGHSLVVKEPVGVVAAITPWNYPLHQAVAKVAPALAAGCTVVLKPSEVAPLSAFILAEVVEAAGLPRGVFNLVTGYGPVVGEALARHGEVDMVSFTGSTRAGRRVGELAAQSVKRLALELGGKSAAVLLEDADFPKAVKATVNSCFLNSGQTCTALTRLLVPRARQEEAVRLAVENAGRFTVGDPFSGEAKLGPLASAAQRERVAGYIRQGVEEGARLALGGPERPEGLPQGYYVKPTVFADVAPRMTIAQEEIFGPVLSILSHDFEDDAVRIANDTPYGLAAAVWSADTDRAGRVARRLRAGQVDVNGGRFNLLAPFGGFKQSGHGRELGRYGLEEFLEVKSVQY